MVKGFGEEAILYNWLRNRNTIEFLGIWETIYNPNFKPIELERFKNEAGLNRFSLSPQKWIEATNAIGIVSKSGRYSGGTFAHKDIAFEFGSWLSPEFKLYLIKEFNKIFANEADILNVALFRKTAKDWQKKFPGLSGNMRDYASLEQLVVLSNLESMNSVFIRQGLSEPDRLVKLNEIAIIQMTSLLGSRAIKNLSR